MRHFTVTRVFILTVILAGFINRPSLAAGQGPQVMTIFLKLDGFAGSSTDDKHAGEIEIASFNWSETNKERGKADPHDALVLKAIDATTPKLAEAVVAGKIISSATVTVRALVNGKPADLVQYVFSDVQITAVSHTVIQRAEEQVQFKYGKLVIRYLSPDGKNVEAPATKGE